MSDPKKYQQLFDKSALLAKARALAGLDDFGDGGFQIGLQYFLDGVNEEGQLSETGAAIMESTVIRFLVNRLRFEADLKKHPEILDEVIVPPIIVMGLPRSGTTKMQRMLASDPRFQALRVWQQMNPAPFPGGMDQNGRDPRIAAAEEVDAMVDAYMPELLAGHPIRAEDVDEESVTLMEMNFEHILIAMRIDSDRYREWVKSRSSKPAYLYMRKMLQYLQWQTHSAGKPWILKAPLHISELDTIIEVFPGATLVHCHRDPAVAVTSLMRLAEIPRRVIYDNLDPRKLGAWMLDLMAECVRKNLALRAALGDRLQIIDAAFRDITTNPIPLLERIYAKHRMPLSSETKQAILRWEADHPGNKYGKFAYDMAHYGKTPRDFDEAFSEYRQRFAEFLLA